ncbi:hypothetical protein KDH_22720 [Dictyobacter sp. S3.2.2.5]|uniref:Uncharacterized protein n=1 Tax=Dictyobacter halimunensis TaxID=3026934 RepID=A0ABQ6FSG2_9CHLR|nr:hypothetical protein KDH_22720 [Dictyobacter sp. S3.2.2.5]
MTPINNAIGRDVLKNNKHITVIKIKLYDKGSSDIALFFVIMATLPGRGGSENAAGWYEAR